MGSEESKGYKPQTLKRESWKEVKIYNRQGKPEHGLYRVLVNQLTNDELEEHLVLFDNLPEFQKYLDFCGWRERDENIVNSKYLNYEQNSQFCSTSYRAKVYIEHIPVRLSDIEDIPYPENIYVLLSSLAGFKKLYQIAGYFKITEDLVCMDKDGRVKVWLNPDLSKCFTDTQSDEDILEPRSQAFEARMVDEIIRLIEKNTTASIEADMSISDFIWQKYRGKGIGFKLAMQELIQYAQRYNAQIPNYFESVIGIFQEEEVENEEEGDESQSPYFHSTERRSLLPREYENQVVSYQHGSERNSLSLHKNAQKLNSLQTMNRIPTYEHMKTKDIGQQPKSNIFTFKQGSQPNFQMSECAVYPRAQSPIDALPSANMNASTPKVFFNYQSQLENPKTIAQETLSKTEMVRALSLPVNSSSANLDFTSKMQANPSLRGLFSDQRLIFSDSSTTYELDAELTQDMIKYLIF